MLNYQPLVSSTMTEICVTDTFLCILKLTQNTFTKMYMWTDVVNLSSPPMEAYII